MREKLYALVTILLQSSDHWISGNKSFLWLASVVFVSSHRIQEEAVLIFNQCMWGPRELNLQTNLMKDF